MKTILLTRGYVAKVDDEDYDRLVIFSWRVKIEYRKGVIVGMYAYRHVNDGEKWTTRKMHRDVMRMTDPSIGIDHEDHDGLNNQKYNLRRATKGQNAANIQKSKYKGITFSKNRQKWVAQIMVNGRGKFLGYFQNPEDAALAYNAAASTAFGQFACLNQVSEIGRKA